MKSNKIGIWILFIICYLMLGAWSFAQAMGGPAPEKKEEPKYKLEILKMEIITAPTPSAETTCEAE